MVNAAEIKNKIIEIVKRRGPSLPIQIAKELNMNSLFISAFLSELVNEKAMKISYLKVGGSPLYMLEGQESQLENFYKFMHPKEAEAFLLLKNSKILKDSEQEPSIRVALRQSRDFAFAFKKDDEIYWRYLTVPESEVKDILEPELKKPKKEIKELIISLQKEEHPKAIRAKKLPKPKELQSKLEPEFQNPLASKPAQKKEKIRPKSEFILKTINFLGKNNFRILEEKEYKTKEYNCISQLNTELGPIDFLTQAKDKKTISDEDLDTLLRKAQSIPLPALMLYQDNLTKKALEYLERYYSIIKAKKISP